MQKLIKLIVFSLLIIVGGNLRSQTLKIVSFNIRYNPYYQTDGINCWDNRRDAVVRMIEDEEPDAIGLQEALPDQLEYLDKHLLNYRRIGVGRDNGIDGGEFMAIYYNIKHLELVSATTRWLSETPCTPSLGWDAACNRTVTIARFRDRRSKKEFVYLNTHLDHVGTAARTNSTQLIANMISERLDKNTPLIVGGDMNSTIKDPIFQSFYNIGLQDARKMPRRTSNSITYNAFGNNVGATIDHFFIRAMKVKRFRTLNRNYGVPYISDHYPIEIRVQL